MRQQVASAFCEAEYQGYVFESNRTWRLVLNHCRLHTMEANYDLPLKVRVDLLGGSKKIM